MEFAAFRRKLPGVQVVLAYVLGPIGGEGAMSWPVTGSSRMVAWG